MDAASDAAARRAFPAGVTRLPRGRRWRQASGNSGAGRGRRPRGVSRCHPGPAKIRLGGSDAALDSASNERPGDDDGRRCRGTASGYRSPGPLRSSRSSSPPASCAPLLSSALLLSFSLRRTSCRRRRIPWTRSRASSSAPRMCARRLPSRGPCRRRPTRYRSCSSAAASGEPTRRTRTGMLGVLSEDAGESIENRRGSWIGQTVVGCVPAREILACTPSTASRAGRPSLTTCDRVAAARRAACPTAGRR